MKLSKVFWVTFGVTLFFGIATVVLGIMAIWSHGEVGKDLGNTAIVFAVLTFMGATATITAVDL